MTAPSDEVLDENARRWFDRVADKADELEALALEWKFSRYAVEEFSAEIDEAGSIDPTLAFGLPQAAVVMDLATRLHGVVAEGRKDFR